jgi:hypothetical protein
VLIARRPPTTEQTCWVLLVIFNGSDTIGNSTYKVGTTVTLKGAIDGVFTLHYIQHCCCRRGGLVVSVFATGPKGRGFEPGQDDGFLRAAYLSLGWEVKPEGPTS